MKPLNHTGRKAPRAAGQALVEFSLILPILLIVILGIIDFGRVLFIFSGASSAVRDATRQATLVGIDPNDNVERYRACTTIDSLAGDFLLANRNAPDSVINSVDVLYFDTTDDTDTPLTRTLAEIETALDTIDTDIESNTLAEVQAALAGADYDCDGSGGVRDQNPNVVGDVITNGDLMMVVLDTSVPFITPILGDLFEGLDLVFRSQRSIVTELVLVVEPQDLDGDGLRDDWEFNNFGCVLDGTDEINDQAFILPDGNVVARIPNDPNYAYVTQTSVNNILTAVANDNTIPSPVLVTPETQDPIHPDVGSATFTGDCARDRLAKSLLGWEGDNPTSQASTDAKAIADNDGFYDCDTVSVNDDGTFFFDECIVLATELFNALDDPDEDGCVNGCEEGRATDPITTDAADSTDTDSDGITDLAEIAAGLDPTDPDTDGDGLLDGEERCERVNAVDPTICDSLPPNVGQPLWTGRWHDTNPNNADTDGDGLDDFRESIIDPTDPDYTGTEADDGDTDNDGINDGDEVNGFRVTLTIDGITFTTNLIITEPTNDDSDGDGLLDGVEFNGTVAVNNDVDGAITVTTHPNDADTDDDGMCDGDGTAGVGAQGACSGVADINPIKSDTDGDSLNDYLEQYTYTDLNGYTAGVLADNRDSDTDQCTAAELAILGFAPTDDPFDPLSDTEEILGDQAQNYTDGAADPVDPDADLSVNSIDDDSDGDGLSDCAEIYIYGTNPYNTDTDEGGLTDDQEVLAALCNPNDGTDDGSCLTGDAFLDNDNGDGTGDGLPDAWEIFYYGDITLYGPADDALDLDANGNPLTDNCNMLCEFNRGTDPTLSDTDGDLVRDGFEIGTIATDADTDNDGLLDGEEGAFGGTCVDDAYNPNAPVARICYETDPRLRDTDVDGIDDGDEIAPPVYPGPAVAPTNPTDPDTDDDGLLDGEEVTAYTYNFTVIRPVDLGVPTAYTNPTYGTNGYTNPNAADTDGDGLNDYNERFFYNTDPNYADTDLDGILDGTRTGIHTGELDDDFEDVDNGRFGHQTDPQLADTDDDGLSDWQEINPSTASATYPTTVNPIEISYDDDGNPITPNVLLTVNVVPFDSLNYDAATMLNPNGADTDMDTLNDGDEVFPPDPADVTNPLDYDTDNDDDGSFTLSDGAETNDGDPTTDPLVYNGPPIGPTDDDGDGLILTDETIFGTSDMDPDTDDDGLTDPIEQAGLTISYRWFTTDGTQNDEVDLAIQTEGTDDFTPLDALYSDGFDTDDDGLMDSYEIYWYEADETAILDTANGFTDFATVGAAANCDWLENSNLVGHSDFTGATQQPLDPSKIDTDEDGLYDATECLDNTINTATVASFTNPFDGRDAEAMFQRVLGTTPDANDTLLYDAIVLAINGDPEGAHDLLVAEGIPILADGRIELLVRRLQGPELGSALTTACGDAFDGATVQTNVCGVVDINDFTVTEPNNNNGQTADDVLTVYMAPSAILELIAQAEGVDLLFDGTSIGTQQAMANFDSVDLP